MSNRILDVMDALDAGVQRGEQFSITVIDKRTMRKFTPRNWARLRAFCDPPRRLAFVVLRYDADRSRASRKLPTHTVCGIYASADHLELLSAATIERAMNSDATLPPLPDTRYSDPREMLPWLIDPVGETRQ